MSAYEPETVDVEAEIERRVAEKLAERGVKPQSTEQEKLADIYAANNNDEIKAALKKHNMLAETY